MSSTDIPKWESPDPGSSGAASARNDDLELEHGELGKKRVPRLPIPTKADLSVVQRNSHLRPERVKTPEPQEQKQEGLIQDEIILLRKLLARLSSVTEGEGGVENSEGKKEIAQTSQKAKKKGFRRDGTDEVPSWKDDHSVSVDLPPSIGSNFGMGLPGRIDQPESASDEFSDIMPVKKANPIFAWWCLGTVLFVLFIIVVIVKRDSLGG